VVVAGGLAALGAWLLNRHQNGGAAGPRSSNW